MSHSYRFASSLLSRTSLLLLAFIAAGVLGIPDGAVRSAAEETPVVDPFPRSFFAQHCSSCHAGAMPEGEFHEDQLSLDFADQRQRASWLSVLRQLQDGTMPPSDEPRPPAAEVKELVDWISQQIATAVRDQNDQRGRVVMRRLTRAEYLNTIRDLLGVDVDLTDLLPLEAPADGFDTNAQAQHISAYWMDGYLEAADRALDAAIASGSRPNTIDKRFDIKNERTVKPTGSVYRHEQDGVAVFSSWVSANIQITLWSFQTRGRGKYRFRISGYGTQTDKPVTFHVMAGPMSAAAQQYLIGYFSVPPGEPTVIEFVEQMESGLTIRIIADGLGVTPPQVQKIGAENYEGPGLLIQWVDIEGPLIESWPPDSHRRIFGDLEQESVHGSDDVRRREVVSSEPLVDAERILLRFARRAFRRAVTQADIQPFLTRVSGQLQQGYSFEQAMRVALTGMMLSPDFLFLREQPGKLDDFALASRLSYFLWSSMPDDELLSLAERNELNRPECMREQVERMLRDPKAEAFTKNFASQWLGLETIDATAPDGMLYPEYDDIHTVKNLPVLLCGGGFRHGQHLAFDPHNPPSLCNLYVSMLQRLGIEADQFATSTGTLTGLEPLG